MANVAPFFVLKFVRRRQTVAAGTMEPLETRHREACARACRGILAYCRRRRGSGGVLVLVCIEQAKKYFTPSLTRWLLKNQLCTEAVRSRWGAMEQMVLRQLRQALQIDPRIPGRTAPDRRKKAQQPAGAPQAAGLPAAPAPPPAVAGGAGAAPPAPGSGP